MKYDKDKTIEFWDNAAKTYEELYNNDSYSPLFYRSKIIKKILSEMPPGLIFDAGCGAGIVLEQLKNEGYKCIGCDISPKMVEEAKKKGMLVYNASIDDLKMISDNYFDIVLCLGVLSYVDDEHEKKSYSELNRILKTGGVLISSHQNELFNMYSMNKHTVNFYNNFIDLFGKFIPEKEYIDIKKKIEELLSNPKSPETTTPRNENEKLSARDYIFRREENPLCFGDKLRVFGFESLDYFYYNFHALPPKYNLDSRFRDISKELENFACEEWQAMFMCSSFVNVAIKVSNSLKRKV